MASATSIKESSKPGAEAVDEENQDPILDEWDKAASTSKAPIVTDMPVRTSSNSDAWRDIEVKVKKTWAHRAFIWLVYISVLIHFLMLVSQLIGVYFYWMSSVQGIMRCYVIAMCICAIFTELQMTQFIRESAILNIWITRGLFYSLIGVMAMDEMEGELEGKHWDAPGRSELVFFVELMSGVMVGLGLLYYIMGCFCVQVYKNKVYADFERRRQEIKAAQKGIAFEDVPVT